MAKRKKIPPVNQELTKALSRLTQAQLRTMYKIAKVPSKGLTPFFTAPYNMIALRNSIHKGTT